MLFVMRAQLSANMKLKHLEFIMATFEAAVEAPGAEHYLPERQASATKKALKLLKKEIKRGKSYEK